MEIFADTANLDDLKEFMSMGLIDGCTTNPLICAKAGIKDMKSHAEKILKILGPKHHLSLEVTTNDLAEMVKEVANIASWHNSDKRIAVKVPMNRAGLMAMQHNYIKPVRFNVTACMNSNQALLAAKSGASFTSLFWGRIEDMGYDASQVVRETHHIFCEAEIKAQIIVGSIRTVSDFTRASKTGADILTVPSELLRKLIYHPRTESTINEFLEEYRKLK